MVRESDRSSGRYRRREMEKLLEEIASVIWADFVCTYKINNIIIIKQKPSP